MGRGWTLRQVITRAPLRVSFFGGGSDYPWYYFDKEGLCISTAIDKYVFVSVKSHFPAFGETFRISYSTTETANYLSEIKNDIVRGALEMMNVSQPLQITTWADLPSGTGLGSSSSVAVALLRALSEFTGKVRSNGEIAQMASKLELEHLGRTMGMQDQFASVIGGFNALRFSSSGTTVQPIFASERVQEIFRNCRLIWTELQRDASHEGYKSQISIPIEQKKESLDLLVRQAKHVLEKILIGDLTIHEFGGLLHSSWQAKKLSLTSQHPSIDTIYDECLRLGAYGGKLLGAGGGGFFLVVGSVAAIQAIDEKFGEKSIPFSESKSGSEVIYVQH